MVVVGMRVSCSLIGILKSITSVVGTYDYLASVLVPFSIETC